MLIIIIGTLKEHFQQVDMKHLDANKPLSFIYTKKYKSEVDNFISQIHLDQKEFFKKTYYRIDPVLPFDVQKSRILWLYENKYIAEKEYRTILNELENKKLIDGE